MPTNREIGAFTPISLITTFNIEAFGVSIDDLIDGESISP